MPGISSALAAPDLIPAPTTSGMSARETGSPPHFWELPVPTPTAVPDSILKANAARRYYSLERRIREALESAAPLNHEHRRALADLLLNGLNR
jgi:hypothetical protein